MVFYCKNCDIDFEVDDKECEGYYNWKCPDCGDISPKKDMMHGFGIIWKCDTGTYRKTDSVKKTNSNPVDTKCAGCPHAS